MATTTQVLGKVGLVDKGVYDVSTEYSRLDFVTDENNISTYISKVDNNQGHSLEDPDYWRYLAKGKANTPAEVLDLLLQADGPGSGVDADKLDGTELEEIVNPEEVTSASPFDFFLGAKEVEQEDGTKKWVFQKMSPETMATVAAGLIGEANMNKSGLMSSDASVRLRKLQCTNNSVLRICGFTASYQSLLISGTENVSGSRYDIALITGNTTIPTKIGTLPNGIHIYRRNSIVWIKADASRHTDFHIPLFSDQLLYLDRAEIPTDAVEL